MTPSPPDPSRLGNEALVELGFSPLEARVYVELLTGAPRTGYQIAHAIDKPVANTYKAIKSLEIRGAVMVTAGTKRVCRAVPYDKLLGRLDREFRSRRDRAVEALSTLPAPAADEGVYDLRTADQVSERFRLMLEQAEDQVVVDAFPQVLTLFTDDIERCAARGIQVTLKVYEPIDVAGVDLILAHPRPNLMERWPGQWLNIVVDSSQHMLAFLTRDCQGVLRAIWTDSRHLTAIYYCGIRAETTLDRVGAVLQRKGTHAEIKAAFDTFGQVDFSGTPGRRELLASYSPDPDPTHEKGQDEQ
ncbi:MAG: TrmB family transcriptional regulator [bacterium]|nr:TrmB family transcriptional regulator [bacterium]